MYLFQLVSNAIQFLASVCERPHYKHLFEDQNTLTSICEKVIVPNMEFRGKRLQRSLRFQIQNVKDVKIELFSGRVAKKNIAPKFMRVLNEDTKGLMGVVFKSD